MDFPDFWNPLLEKVGEWRFLLVADFDFLTDVVLLFVFISNSLYLLNIITK